MELERGVMPVRNDIRCIWRHQKQKGGSRGGFLPFLQTLEKNAHPIGVLAEVAAPAVLARITPDWSVKK